MSRVCERLHEKFSALPKLSYGYGKEQVPNNGLYVVFENGETAHNTNRIVRIGTHTGEDNLSKRINEHLYTPNKDRSIFRKHIGRCILAKRDDLFLEQWEIDLTPRANRDKYKKKINLKKQKKIEQEVSAYIKDNISFAVVEIKNKQKRQDMEKAMIFAISACSDCGPSKKWLGLHHPEPKIRNAGLWNVQGLSK